MVDANEEGGVTVVLRVVRSFPHRNIRPLVLKGVPLSLTAQQFLERSKEAVASDASFPPPFRKFTYDSLKIEHQAGGAKTSDPVISKEGDETLVLIKPADRTDGNALKTIGELGVRAETELSLFSWKDYVDYREGDAHGQTQW